MSIYIGTSGWSYPHWRGVVYPPGTPSAKQLDLYVRRLNSVEVNGSFYHWPRDSTFEAWRKRTPDGFIVTVKAPRGLTHARKLREPEVWIERIARGLAALGDRRGPLLVQLPPDLEFDPDRLDCFLARVPRWIQVVVEFRHASWHQETTFELLAARGAAYCIMSGVGLPCVLRVTGPCAYVRLHGPTEHLYAGSYSDDQLGWWADRIREWRAAGQDVYAYFNNDDRGYAFFNAERLRAMLGV